MSIELTAVRSDHELGWVALATAVLSLGTVSCGASEMSSSGSAPRYSKFPSVTAERSLLVRPTTVPTSGDTGWRRPWLTRSVSSGYRKASGTSAACSAEPPRRLGKIANTSAKPGA